MRGCILAPGVKQGRAGQGESWVPDGHSAMHSSKGGVRRQTLHMGCEQQLRCSAAVADCASTQPSRCVALVSEHPRVHMKCQCHRGHAAALLERLALQQMHRCHALLMGCRLRLRTSIQVVKQTGTLSSSAARQGQVQALRCCNDPQSTSLTNENAVLALPGAVLHTKPTPALRSPLA